MAWLVFIILLIVGLVVLAKKFGGEGQRIGHFPYQKIDLFSPAERSFLGVLDQALESKYRLLAKVRVADVIGVVAMRDRRKWQMAFNRISAKHFDYVICAKDTLAVLAVVELDDSSHSAGKRAARDAFLEDVCVASGMALLRFPAKHAYSVLEVRQRIFDVLEPKPDVLPLTAGEAPEASPQATLAPVVVEAGKTEVAVDVCPRCKSALVQRMAKSGQHAGKLFTACSAYPKCRYIAPAAVSQG